MHEFDLIPDDYRQALRMRRLLLRSGLGVVLVVALIAVATALAAHYTQAMEQQIAAMQEQRDDFDLQRRQLDELQKAQRTLQRELSFLDGLRSGIRVSELLQAVDRALGDGPLWFQDWSFQRASTLVDAPPQAATQGYFIVLPPSGQPQQKQAIRQDTSMSIQGQARDHVILSTFIRRLFNQPPVADVNLNSTTIRRYTQHSVIEFDLQVSLHPPQPEPGG